MCHFETLGVSWPPRGWKQLGHIEKPFGQAIAKDPVFAKVTGLSYQIDPFPVRNEQEVPFFSYHIQINGWEYNIHNESNEYSVLSFVLQERLSLSSLKNFYIYDIKTKSRPVCTTERSVHRSLMAALFMIKQIDCEQVPDVEKILRLYKIHPSQRSLYEIDNIKKSFRYFGVPFFNSHKKDMGDAG